VKCEQFGADFGWFVEELLRIVGQIRTEEGRLNSKIATKAAVKGRLMPK
jgi:hypothetical protein